MWPFLSNQMCVMTDWCNPQDSSRNTVQRCENGFVKDSCQSQASKDMPAIMKITTKNYTASTISTVIAGAHDMLTCVRNLSSTMKLNMYLLTNAVHFTENVLSLLTVLLSLQEETAGLKKSAQAVREEAADWKNKSAMIDDVLSYLKAVSSTNLPSAHAHFKIPAKASKTVSGVSETAKLGKSSACWESPLIRNQDLPSSVTLASHSSTEVRITPDSSTSFLLPIKSESTDDPEDSESGINSQVSSIDAQSLRRSFRSKSTVDTLVYWPSFKKDIRLSKSVVCKQKLKKSSTSQLKAPAVLDSLLLKRQVSSESGDPGKTSDNKKWLVVHKNKASCGSKVNKKKGLSENINLQTHDRSPTVSSSCQKSPKVREVNDCKDAEKGRKSSLSECCYECKVCGKILSCSRSFNAHMMMHDGKSSFPCNYCKKKFTSGWNRAQHERVHTGEKPYVCDICSVSFRYNVTLRHHKSKWH